jgi:16S rRNA processing protein RimM
LLLVGKVIKPHGLEGVLRILSYAYSETSFLDSGSVFLRTVSGEILEYAVKSVRPYKKQFLMELEGLTSTDQAEAYRGAEILIWRHTLVRGEDEFFWFELLGIKVYMDTGEYLGVISQIIPTGSNDIYVVTKGTQEILVPATHEVVHEIDLESGRMTVSEMEGLFGLNAV